MTEEVLTIREGYTNDDSVESFQYIEIVIMGPAT